MKTSSPSLLVLLLTLTCLSEVLAEPKQISVPLPDKGSWETNQGENYGPDTEASISTENSPANTIVVRFQYQILDPKKRGESASAQFTLKDPLTLEGEPAEMEVWVKGDGSDQVMFVIFVDNDKSFHQWKLADPLKFTDWKKIKIPLDFSTDGYCTWGPNRPSIVGGTEMAKGIHLGLPLRFLGFSIAHFKTNEEVHGSVAISDPKIFMKP